MKSILKRTTIIGTLLLASISLNAQTAISTPMVSGHWTLAGSPYQIETNITIYPGTALIIDPGVEVVMEGNYKIQVDGDITAVGTDSLPITFHVADTTGWADTGTAGGWSGICMGNYPVVSTDTSIFSYCNFYDMKGTGFYVEYLATRLLHSNFTHNSGDMIYATMQDSTMTFEMGNCNVYNNYSGMTYQLISTYGGTLLLHDNSIHNNTTVNNLMILEHNSLIVEHNEIYQNLQQDSSFVTSLSISNSNGIVRGNKIHHNLSQYAAALACTDGIVDINANLICNNSTVTGVTGSSSCGSLEGGGGVRISGEGATQPTHFLVRNNIIANNYAAYAGGGIYVMLTSATIVNNDFLNNRGLFGGGVFIFNDTLTNGYSMVSIKNNIFRNNITLSAGTGGLPDTTIAVWITNGDSLTYANNWTTNTFSRDYFMEGLATPLLVGDTTTNVIGTDPLLVAPTLTANVAEDATTANFALQDSSGCIDKGDNNCYPDSTDYAGGTRIIGSHIDIGAYESLASHTLQVLDDATQTPINVYPNPASNVVYISTTIASGYVFVSNMAGQIVCVKEVNSPISFIDVKGLAKGIYSIQLVSQQRVVGGTTLSIK